MTSQRNLGSRITSLLTWTLSLLSLATAAHAQQYESVAHAVRHYNTPTSCFCQGGDGKPCTEPAVWETYAATFTNRMASTMKYDQTNKWLNEAVDPADFLDVNTTDWQSGGKYGKDSTDPYGTDFADVIFYAGHSNHTCDSANGYRYAFAMGNAHAGQQCWMQTNKDIIWGDAAGNGDANVAILFSCESVQYCVWQAHGYDRMAQGQFNTLLGFHGEMMLSGANNSRLDGYLSGTRDDGIGDDWIDEMTTINPGSSNDECGTVVIFGSSKAAEDDQFYNGGFKDLKNTGAHTSSTFYGIMNCDPLNGQKLDMLTPL